MRGLAGDYSAAPDVVAYPKSEADVAALLDWAGGADAAVVPFGAGSSVVGGIEPRGAAERKRGVLTIDLGGMGRVLEVDRAARAARIEGGAFGPAIEGQLKPHGLTLRHFPQSFEYSTLGGWIATRSGGHFASLYTHIDDFVESVRMLTPKGALETRRLPGSGAGPAPERLVIGSEGILGIITEAWMRLQDRPRFRAGSSVAFPGSLRGDARALRLVSQSALFPANCRVLDPAEAYNTGAGDGRSAIMVLAFESGDHHGRRRDEARAGNLRRRRRQGRSARTRPTRISPARPGAGAMPSSACPMRARSRSGSPSSTTRSRPRSPGTGSSASTTP